MSGYFCVCHKRERNIENKRLGVFNYLHKEMLKLSLCIIN